MLNWWQNNIWTNNFEMSWYSALPISHGHSSLNNSQETPIARPLGRAMGVLRGFKVWPTLYRRGHFVVCNIVLYCTAIYWESTVQIFILRPECGRVNESVIKFNGRDKMAIILLTTFLHAFSFTSIAVSWLKFHKNIFPVVKLTKYQI